MSLNPFWGLQYCSTCDSSGSDWDWSQSFLIWPLSVIFWSLCTILTAQWETLWTQFVLLRINPYLFVSIVCFHSAFKMSFVFDLHTFRDDIEHQALLFCLSLILINTKSLNAALTIFHCCWRICNVNHRKSFFYNYLIDKHFAVTEAANTIKIKVAPQRSRTDGTQFALHIQL